MLRGPCWAGPRAGSRTPCESTSAGTKSQGLGTLRLCSCPLGTGCRPPAPILSKRRGLSCLPGAEAAAARGGRGRRSCLLLCHLACQPIFYILTLVATQESRGMGRCPAQGPRAASPGAGVQSGLGCFEAQLLLPVLLWRPRILRHQPGAQGSPPPSSPTRAWMLCTIKRSSAFCVWNFFSPRGQYEHEDLCCTDKFKLRKTHLLKYCIFFSSQSTILEK